VRALYASSDIYRERKRKRFRKWKADMTPAKRKAYNRNRALIWSYGLSADKVQEMIKALGSRCQICQKKTKLQVDHDHKTGTVRGMICQSCNTAIGLLGDNLDGIMAVVRYLQCHAGV
jgi:hypothetical protein